MKITAVLAAGLFLSTASAAYGQPAGSDVLTACHDTPVLRVAVERFADAPQRDELVALRDGVAVVPKGDAMSARDLASAYDSFDQKTEAKLPAQHPLLLLAPGPVLDGPDEAALTGLECAGGVMRFSVVVTKVRLQDTTLRRNIIWRPLLVAEFPALAAGRHRVEVSWQTMTEIPGGQPLEPPAEYALVFRVN